MINILYPPYKDEILYSWYSRHDFCSGIFNSTNIKEWFNSKVGVKDMFYIGNLKYFCNQVPKQLDLTFDDLKYFNVALQTLYPSNRSHTIDGKNLE